jgi:hypothetical protein
MSKYSGIAAGNVLLRAQTELPIGLNVPTEEFGEGWDLMLPGDMKQLNEKILAQGWNLIRIEHGPQRSGVGDSREEAISAALRRSLRHISEYFNAVEVDCFELTQYPWFFLATVMLCPCRIQKDAVQFVPEDAPSPPVVAPHRRSPANLPGLYPRFSAAMPMPGELLAFSRSTSRKAQ